MDSFTESERYRNLIKNMTKKDKEDRNWKAVVTLVTDTQLLNFLKTKYPEVLQEFYEGRIKEDADKSNTKVWS